MLRVIIIDDEQNGIDSLKLLIAQYVQDVKVVADTTDSRKAVGLIEDYKPEIVFLDINMPNLDGFGVLQQCSFKDFHLVFITAYREHALRAIKNNALDYLLKPVDIDDLLKALEKIKKKRMEPVTPDMKLLLKEMQAERRKIMITSKNEVIYLNQDDIIRAEADSNCTLFYTVSGERFLVSKTLKEYEPLLCSGQDFMRVHHSHIINLKYVVRFYKKLNGFIIMKNNHEVPLSRNKREEFLGWLNIQ